jgi:UDP-GlcNAc:undecaprenyl-phosphate GlcNAc-1-phosphate transferase
MPTAMTYCMNAFLLSFVLILAMQKLAKHFGLVDVPSEIKSHEGRIPLVGAAMFLAFGLAVILLDQPPRGFTDLLIGLLLIVSLGVIDDMFNLSARVKLVGQCLCVAIVVLPKEFLIQDAGALFSEHPFLLFNAAIPVTIFAVVGMINATNMIDGLDGLAGGIALIALTWLAIAAAKLGLPSELMLTLVLAFSVLGFLVFNFRHPWRARASVFMGDAGSMMLGLSLAFVAISLSQRNAPSLPPVAVLWIFALPVIDTLSLMIRRVVSGQGLLSSDRRHIHDLLMEVGLGVNATVITLLAVSGILGGVGIAGWLFGVPDRLLLLGLAIPVLLHTWFACLGWKLLKPLTFPLTAAAGTALQPEASVERAGHR